MGPLPPSSSSSGFAPACLATASPTGKLPVKPTACVPGLETISSPTSLPPKRRLQAPSGTPASSRHWSSSAATSEVVGAGFQTTAVAGRERRREVLARDADRVVPRRDHRHDAVGLADRQHPLAGRATEGRAVARRSTYRRHRGRGRRRTRPRRAPRAAACPARATASGRAPRDAPRFARRSPRRASRARGRRAQPSRAAPARRPRSRAARPRVPPRARRPTPRPSPGSRS